MSAYVVHYKEFRFDVNGRNFNNAGGEMLVTDQPNTEIDSLYDLLQLSSTELQQIKSISFFAQAPEPHGPFMTTMKISRVDRFSNGGAKVFGADGSFIAANLTEVEAEKKATFTDANVCIGSCPLVSDMPESSMSPDDAHRRLSTHLSDHLDHPDLPARRKLWWWSSSSNSGSSTTSTPAWKATSSCSWMCKQGWWWQSDSYGKPACCSETKGSPYDNCNYNTCSCDASCRSCCN